MSILCGFLIAFPELRNDNNNQQHRKMHRITLKTLNSFVKVPKFNADQLAENDELDEIEYEDFYWQQKRFNANELEQFRNADNCKTDTHKRYHQQILNELADRDENDPNNCRIFSYVMDDKFKPPKMELDESSDAQLVENVESYGDWHEAGGRGNAPRLLKDEIRPKND